MQKPALIGSETSRFTTVQLGVRQGQSEPQGGFAELLVIYDPPPGCPEVVIITGGPKQFHDEWGFDSQEAALAAWRDSCFYVEDMSQQSGCIHHHRTKRQTMVPWCYAMEGEEFVEGGWYVDRLSVDSLIAVYRDSGLRWEDRRDRPRLSSEQVAGYLLDRYEGQAEVAVIILAREPGSARRTRLPGQNWHARDVIDLLEQIPQEVPAR